MLNPENLFGVISIEVILQDSRTGYICYRSTLNIERGRLDTSEAFTEALIDGMQRSGIAGVVYGQRPSINNKAETAERMLALWLPERLGMSGTLRLQSPTKPWRSTEPLHLRFTPAEYLDDLERGDALDSFFDSKIFQIDSGLENDKAYDATKIIQRIEKDDSAEGVGYIVGIEGPEFNKLWAVGYGDHRTVRASDIEDIIIRFKKNCAVFGGAAIFPGRLLQLKLDSDAIKAGVRFVTKVKAEVAHLIVPIETLFLSPSTHSAPGTSVTVTGAYFTPTTPWFRPFELTLETPADHIASFNPDNTLCADRCMTLGAHVYDTGGAQDNGVDENTGLFHAHYPLATLRGRGGKGPELDLTLHYSPARANEGALGDGWAFRFSYFDNRRRVLTLSSGQTLTLTKAQMSSLSADKARFLDQDGYRITAVEGDGDAWTTLTIQMPAGSEGRQEVLQLPIIHDNKEAGENYKSQYKTKLKKIIANLTQWIDKEKITTEQIEDLKRQREAWKTELSELDRKALVLVTSSIRSPQGGELSLAWQGTEGHIRLKSISDTATGTVLLAARHGSILAQGSSQSTFTVWPNTPECYQMTLNIRNCLLESIKRHRKDEEQSPERHVQFGYGLDPALDRVLTSIAEEDGSLETVMYQFHGTPHYPLAPRVDVHTLVPGAGQQCISHRYEWKGEYVVEQLHKRQLTSAGIDAGPFVRTTWTFNGGVRVIDSIMEEQPGVSRRTTRFTYPTTAPANDYKHLILSRPTKTEVTTESLTSA